MFGNLEVPNLENTSWEVATWENTFGKVPIKLFHKAPRNIFKPIFENSTKQLFNVEFIIEKSFHILFYKYFQKRFPYDISLTVLKS